MSTSTPTAASPVKPTSATVAASSSTPVSPASEPRSGPVLAVALGEAALDSPTFRALTAHFADQVDGIERWLDGYVRSTSKLVSDMLSLEDSINTYLGRMTPPTMGASQSTDAVIDVDYTLLALRRAGDGARDWWAQILSTVRRLDSLSADPIRTFMNGELRNFKEVRRMLETTQKTFDNALARYVGQSKMKEPSALREDAFSVYETRKAYLKASMDFCQLAPQLRFSLDKLLVRACADIYREMRRSRDGTLSSARAAEEMDRLRGWTKEMEALESVFRRELQIARRNIGENTLASYRPSRELEDYNASTVPYLGSKGPANLQRKSQDAVLSEKQGWLFLRVQTGKPVRTSWVRRWYYCREGIFGWLVQGPHGVLQGDEIGVLLCSVKPAVQEERRFCFEVKTKIQTLMLQAETQAELMEWLEVFEVAKKKAMEASMGRDQTPFPAGVDPAFAVTPPSVPEFSAKMLEGLSDEEGRSMERSGTLPIPGQDQHLASRASFDVTSSGPRRTVTALGREEGESGRDHAARIMQKLDLHRKGTTVNSSESALGVASGVGSIATLISASHNLLPGYSGYSTLQAQQGASPRPSQSAPLLAPLEQAPSNLAPITMAKAPVSTHLSRAAVFASAEGALGPETGRRVPSAVMANYWGTNSWASIYSSGTDKPQTPQPDADDVLIATVQEAPARIANEPSIAVSAHRKTLSADSKFAEARILEQPAAEIFPPRYPPELRAQHAQFRLLFPSVSLEEKLVLVFNAAWVSASEDGRDNPAMAGNGRIFVTPDNMYFYGHQMGLIISYKISLDIITEVTAAPGRDCDFIFLHLGQYMNDTGFTRITLKIFLEDLNLLHSRLNLLVDDLQAEEPMGLQEIVTALINLEKEEYDKSPSVESWEEVSSSTPMDNGTASGKPVSRRIQGLASRQKAARGARKPLVKLQLPTSPVVYEPEGMGQSVAEKNYEISAKACFHVLFGDKSFVFPKLYFERRAEEITQGPWELGDHGFMKRVFKFKVNFVDMLGRSKPGDVTDSQTIDIFNDHITYVVTHSSTPWHLPHSQSFKVISVIVITHVAKSKCKLAIFTKVDWSKAPALSKNMVQRQALRDAVNDAEDLAEITTDQVRKLGLHSRTKRAIQVYGNIGQQTQTLVFTPNTASEGGKKPTVRPRTLTAMTVETGRSLTESAITSVIMWIFAVVRRAFIIVRANWIILALLAVSVMCNVVITSQGGAAWWTERRAAKYMSRIGVGPNLVMSKAIYLADLEEALQGTAVAFPKPRDSPCYTTFQSIANATDLDAPYQEAGAAFSTPTSKAAARRLRRTRQRLGTYRHDLVVAMRVINGIEAEMIQSEWENWLTDENVRCEQVQMMLQQADEAGGSHQESGSMSLSPSSSSSSSLSPVTAGTGKKRGQKVVSDDGPDTEKAARNEKRHETLRAWHQEYCGSCEADWKALMAERRFLI